MSIELQVGSALGAAAKAFATAAWEEHDTNSFGFATPKDSFAITATDNGAVIGVAGGWFWMGVGYLSELMVHRDRRGQGVGTKLLAEFESEAERRDHRRLALRTERDDGASAFYASHGWRVEFVVPEWGGGKDFVQMRKDLPAE
jgi:GNAT superfamily N-acetyltransferase